jgi:hypothetical protein
MVSLQLQSGTCTTHRPIVVPVNLSSCTDSLCCNLAPAIDNWGENVLVVMSENVCSVVAEETALGMCTLPQVKNALHAHLKGRLKYGNPAPFQQVFLLCVFP